MSKKQEGHAVYSDAGRHIRARYRLKEKLEKKRQEEDARIAAARSEEEKAAAAAKLAAEKAEKDAETAKFAQEAIEKLTKGEEEDEETRPVVKLAGRSHVTSEGSLPKAVMARLQALVGTGKADKTHIVSRLNGVEKTFTDDVRAECSNPV